MRKLNYGQKRFKVHPKFIRGNSLFQETNFLCKAFHEGYVRVAIQLLLSQPFTPTLHLHYKPLGLHNHLIVPENNRYAQQEKQCLGEDLHWKELTIDEFHTWLGLYFAMGLAQKLLISAYWEEIKKPWLLPLEKPCLGNGLQAFYTFYILLTITLLHHMRRNATDYSR